MTQFFKTIKDYEIALENNEVENEHKIEIVLHAAQKLTNVIVPALASAKLHTTTSRFVERKHKLLDALFFTLQRVLEVKSYPHHLKREELEVLRNTKVSDEEIKNILETFNIGLVVKLADLLKKPESDFKTEEELKNHKKEIILISQVQEIVGTYLSLFENNVNVD